jgi:hypothetical protein
MIGQVFDFQLIRATLFVWRELGTVIFDSLSWPVWRGFATVLKGMYGGYVKAFSDGDAEQNCTVRTNLLP